MNRQFPVSRKEAQQKIDKYFSNIEEEKARKKQLTIDTEVNVLLSRIYHEVNFYCTLPLYPSLFMVIPISFTYKEVVDEITKILKNLSYSVFFYEDAENGLCMILN